MSDKPKFPAAVALRVAKELCDLFKTVTDRIIVAGSLRRWNQYVGDVELLYIPKTEVKPDPQDMFSSMSINLADEVIANLEKARVIERRKNVDGRENFGPLNKLMRHRASGIPVDLFCEPSLDDWWRSLVIRTGPKELNVRLITTAAKRGISVHAYGIGLTDIRGAPIPCDSEQQFFEICGARYLEPENRR